MMAILSSSSIVCPVLIGRRPHLDMLVQFIEQAHSGYGQTVLIAGEAGIGKSRLVAEAIGYARSSLTQIASPTQILGGRCFEPDRSLPYAPFLDVLRSFLALHSPNDLAALLGPTASELVKLLPELASPLPAPVPGPVLEPEQEKRQLFQALKLFLTSLAKTQSLILVIEDLHWSDETSLEFLLYLARHVRLHPILLLLTYRHEEANPVLTRFLAGLDRERLADELLLHRLSNDEVGAMIRAILALPRSVDADFLAMISSLTEGNPFFIEEILRSLIAKGEISATSGTWSRKPTSELHIPRSVQLAVQQRLDHLSAEAREVLSLASVAGRRFDFALLQQLTQRHEADLVQLIKGLITAQLVVEESDEIFAFRHALTRQAVYTDMLARERKALHRLIAETMERLYAEAHESHLDDLSYHFYSAGMWDKALEYAQRAGEKAQRLYAPQAALEHFSHAIQAARHLAVSLPLDLYRARGRVYQTMGEFELAQSDFEQVLDAALTLHNREAEWQSLLALGDLWTERDYERAGDYFQRAIELAREMRNQSTLAYTLNRVGNWYANREQPHEGLPYQQEALAIFHGLNDRHGLAETLDFLGTTSLMSNHLLSGIAYYEQAIALWRTLGNHQVLISSLGMATMRGPNYLSDTLVWLTKNGRACTSDAEEAVALAQQIGWRAGEAYALTFLGIGLGPRGEYARAWMCGQAALDIAIEIEHGLWMTFAHFLLGCLSLDLLDFTKARYHLEVALSLAKESGSLFWLRIITGSLASTCIAQHEFARADSLLDTAAEPTLLIQTTAQRVIWCARAELALASQCPESALQIIDLLIASAHVETGGVIPRLWHLRGEALIACDRKAEAEIVLHAALAAAQVQDLPSRSWRIMITLATLSAAHGRHEQVEELTSEARAMVENLATNAPSDEIRDTFVSSATTQLPRLPALSPRHAAKQTFDGLTEREREVAGLIARGKSNRALAEELIVSERTIEKHVERIMSKLGCDSRAQIAVWAVQKGLLKDGH